MMGIPVMIIGKISGKRKVRNGKVKGREKVRKEYILTEEHLNMN